MRADVAQLADGIGLGIQSAGELAILDETLQQDFQRPGAGRLVDTAFVHVPNEVFEHLAGTRQRHPWSEVGDQYDLVYAFSQL